MRRVSRVAVAWERLRARRKLGTAIAARRAMIATTIMISTRVKPERRDWSLESITGFDDVDVLLLVTAPGLAPQNRHNSHRAIAVPRSGPTRLYALPDDPRPANRGGQMVSPAPRTSFLLRPTTAVFFVAILLRLWVLARYTATPYFALQMGDMKFYHQWALRIVKGQLSD